MKMEMRRVKKVTVESLADDLMPNMKMEKRRMRKVTAESSLADDLMPNMEEAS
jgi:hypothetical protein